MLLERLRVPGVRLWALPGINRWEWPSMLELSWLLVILLIILRLISGRTHTRPSTLRSLLIHLLSLGDP